MMPSAFLNALRREAAEALDTQAVHARPLGLPSPTDPPLLPETATYKDNIANALAKAYYTRNGTKNAEDAFELTHRKGAELMRTKYCIRFELGRCPVHQGAAPSGPLFLLNNGRRLALHFDCAACEMAVTEV